MKLTIQGEMSERTLEDLCEAIAQEAHDATCRVPTATSIKGFADTIMHLAADMYVSADALANARTETS